MCCASQVLTSGGEDSEPLMVLADLQEFGIPGQEVRLPLGPSPKRMLPPLSEEPLLDFPPNSMFGGGTSFMYGHSRNEADFFG